MPLFIVKNDITKMKADAIVNPANPTLLGGGGVDGQIHKAAGPNLLKECKTLGGCGTGEAKITKGYGLPAKYVIHTVGPIWQGGGKGEREYLRSCYKNSLSVAIEYGCETVAFPLISAGAYKYPPAEALEIAKEEIKNFLQGNDITVYLVLRDKIMPEKGRLYSQIEYYLMQNGISATDDIPQDVFPMPLYNMQDAVFPAVANKTQSNVPPSFGKAIESPESQTFSERLSRKFSKKSSAKKQDICECLEECSVGNSLEEMLNNLDKSFSETLLYLIDKSGMSDAECYKRANIDRKLFSKIRMDKNYKPSKPTVLAFAIALSLNLDDTKMLLERAGFALSPSSKFDVIIQYFIAHGIYDIFEINDALFAFEQNLLGA